jgi:hypothetical protein
LRATALNQPKQGRSRYAKKIKRFKDIIPNVLILPFAPDFYLLKWQLQSVFFSECFH